MAEEAVSDAHYHYKRRHICYIHNSKRKYYSYGQNLVMFTHGSEEKLNKLPGIMAVEVPELWAKSRFREVHSGDKHHREEILYRANEQEGVVVRILSSPSPTDAWHASKGFVGALQGSQSFLWDREDGLLAQFTAVAKLGEK